MKRRREMWEEEEQTNNNTLLDHNNNNNSNNNSNNMNKKRKLNPAIDESENCDHNLATNCSVANQRLDLDLSLNLNHKTIQDMKQLQKLKRKQLKAIQKRKLIVTFDDLSSSSSSDDDDYDFNEKQKIIEIDHSSMPAIPVVAASIPAESPIKEKKIISSFSQEADQKLKGCALCNKYTSNLEHFYYCDTGSGSKGSYGYTCGLPETNIDIWRNIAEFSDFHTVLKLGETCSTMAELCYDNDLWTRQISRKNWNQKYLSSYSTSDSDDLTKSTNHINIKSNHMREHLWRDISRLSPNRYNLRRAMINLSKNYSLINQGYSGHWFLKMLDTLQYLSFPMFTLICVLLGNVFDNASAFVPLQVFLVFILSIPMVLSLLLLVGQILCSKRPIYLSHCKYAQHRMKYDLFQEDLSKSMFMRWRLINSDIRITHLTSRWHYVYLLGSIALYALHWTNQVPFFIVAMIQIQVACYPFILLGADEKLNNSLNDVQTLNVFQTALSAIAIPFMGLLLDCSESTQFTQTVNASKIRWLTSQCFIELNLFSGLIFHCMSYPCNKNPTLATGLTLVHNIVVNCVFSNWTWTESVNLIVRALIMYRSSRRSVSRVLGNRDHVVENPIAFSHNNASMWDTVIPFTVALLWKYVIWVTWRIISLVIISNWKVWLLVVLVDWISRLRILTGFLCLLTLAKLQLSFFIIQSLLL